jgi:hypothetical protein
LVRDYYNGRVIPYGIPAKLTEALIWMHQNYENLGSMGSHSNVYAGAFSAKVWADRWVNFVRGGGLTK